MFTASVFDALTVACGFALSLLVAACTLFALRALAREAVETLARRKMARALRLARRRRWAARHGA